MKRIVAILIVLSMAVGLASTASAVSPLIVKNADPQMFDMDAYYENLWNVYQELFEKDMIPYLENEQSQYYIHVAKESEKDWLYNFTVFLTGTELDYETCIEILCNMLVALRMDTIEMMANQKDTNKKTFDYVMDVSGIVAGTIGAESYFGGNFTETMKTVADVIDLTADNIDMLLEVRENAQCMYDTIQCYEVYSEFLSAIATGCRHKEMQEAAGVLLSGMQKLFAAKTHFLSEYVEDYGKYAVEVFGGDLLFGQIMPLLTEGEVAEMWDEGELTALKVLDNTVLFVDNAVSAVKLGKDLGVFACDMLFGATNVRTHVQEALAMTYIREALLKELETCRKTIKSGKDYDKIYKLSRLATGILYANYRGNYCITQALTQDAQLHSVIMQGSGEAERYLKLLQDYHTETVSYGKIAGSMLLPLDDVRIDDDTTNMDKQELLKNCPYVGDVNTWKLKPNQAKAYIDVIEEALIKTEAIQYEWDDAQEMYVSFVDVNGNTLLWLCGVGIIQSDDSLWPRDYYEYNNGYIHIIFEEIWEWDGERPVEFTEISDYGANAKLWSTGIEVYTYYHGTDADGDAWKAFHPIIEGQISPSIECSEAYSWIYNYRLDEEIPEWQIICENYDYEDLAKAYFTAMIENKKWPELNLDLNKMLIEHPYGDVLSDVELLASANSGSDVESFIEKQKSNTPDYSILQCSEYAIKQDESWQDASTVLDLLYEYIK